MRKFTRIITNVVSFATAVIMITTLFGCSNSENANDLQKGGYVEKIIDINCTDPIFSEIVSKDNQIQIYDFKSNSCFSIEDGQSSFNSETIQCIPNNIDKDCIMNGAADGKGNYFLYYFDSKVNDFCSLYLSSDGTTHKIETEDYIISAEFTEDDRLFIVAMGNISEINTTNYSVKSFMNIGQNVYAFDIIGDNIVIVDENGFTMYNYKNVNEINAPDALNDIFDDNSSENYQCNLKYDICYGGKDTMYILTTSGIYRYMINGNQIEKLIDGFKYQIGNPSDSINSFTYLENGTFYVSFKSGKIVKYFFDKELVNEKTSLLKVYSLEKSDSLSYIINDFLIENNTDVDYIIGMKNGITYEDAMKELTTQILSGNAPDVILLDGMDIDNYIDKNLLYNLSACEDEWNPSGNLIDNVAKWNTQDDKLYSVACKFRILGVGADEKSLENIKNYSDIADYVEKTRKELNPDYAVAFMANPETVIKNALIYEGADLLSSQDMDKEKLSKFYDDCAKVYKNDQPEGADCSITINGVENNEYSLSLKAAGAVVDPGIIALGTINTFELDLNLITSIDTFNQNTDFKFRYGINDNEKIFIPSCNLGIIESGKNHEDAIKFIAKALDFETQKVNYNSGLPVNTDTLNYFYKKNESKSNNDTIGIWSFRSEQSYNWEIEWMSNKEVEDFDKYIHSLCTPYYIDNITLDIILESGLKCLNGNITAGQAADNAISQLKLKIIE